MWEKCIKKWRFIFYNCSYQIFIAPLMAITVFFSKRCRFIFWEFFPLMIVAMTPFISFFRNLTRSTILCHYWGIINYRNLKTLLIHNKTSEEWIKVIWNWNSPRGTRLASWRNRDGKPDTCVFMVWRTLRQLTQTHTSSTNIHPLASTQTLITQTHLPHTKTKHTTLSTHTHARLPQTHLHIYHKHRHLPHTFNTHTYNFTTKIL